MSHYIDPTDHYVEDDSLKWEFTIEESDETARDVSSDTLEYYLLEDRGDDEGDAILSDSDAGVDIIIIGDGSSGRVDVVIDQDQTGAYGGDMLWQRFVVDGPDETRQTFHGPFPVERA